MKRTLPAPTIQSEEDCPLVALIDILGGRWKVLVLWSLRDGTKRFTELKRAIPGVTQKMLTQQLRQLEADGLLIRAVFAEVPPRVEYTLSRPGQQLAPFLLTLSTWASANLPKLQVGMKRHSQMPMRS